MKKIEFKSGVSNKSFLTDKYVTRLNSDVSLNPFINRSNELNVLNSCKEFSTKLISFDDDKMVTKYEQLYQYDVKSNITKIIGLIKKIHTKKVNHIFDPFKIIEGSNIDIEYNSELYKEVKEHWKNDEHVLCHNDLLLENIIYNGTEFKLIDFEYSGMNSRYFDLASIISENNIWELKEEIASAYGGIDLDILNKYIFLNDLLWTIWGTQLGHIELVKDKRKRLSEY